MDNCLDCGGSECVCRLRTIVEHLTTACQIWTQSLGNAEGYITTLGAQKTQEALAHMKAAGVAPRFYHAPHEVAEDAMERR